MRVAVCNTKKSKNTFGPPSVNLVDPHPKLHIPETHRGESAIRLESVTSICCGIPHLHSATQIKTGAKCQSHLCCLLLPKLRLMQNVRAHLCCSTIRFECLNAKGWWRSCCFICYVFVPMMSVIWVRKSF
jgi:hypothetical protein